MLYLCHFVFLIFNSVYKSITTCFTMFLYLPYYPNIIVNKTDAGEIFVNKEV